MNAARSLVPCAVPLVAFVCLAGCADSSVQVGPPLVSARPPVAATAAPRPASPVVAPVDGPTFDGELGRFVPAGFTLYAALGDLGPYRHYLTEGPLDRQNLHVLRASLPTSLSTGLAAVVTEVGEASAAAGLIRTTVLELGADGFAFAAAPDATVGQARFLVAVRCQSIRRHRGRPAARRR